MSRCRTCHAPLIWAYTSTGRRMPFNAHPVEDGQWVIVHTAGQASAVHEPGSDQPRYVSHFATCKDCAYWRNQANADQHGR